ncbi:MAG: cell division protein ZapA [Clostridiales bacterium]|jgi:cell division protein ZapA|nr:cell division protein ZapA [Clostridiales bacterium]
MDEKRIEVEIFGEHIFLLSPEDEVYLKSLAAYVNAKMVEIFKFRRALGEKPMVNAMLLGLNIADELFKERQINEKHNRELQKQKAADPARQTDRETEELKENNRKLAEENNRLKQELNKKSKELAAQRKELSDYIDAFDADRK